MTEKQPRKTAAEYFGTTDVVRQLELIAEKGAIYTAAHITDEVCAAAAARILADETHIFNLEQGNAA